MWRGVDTRSAGISIVDDGSISDALFRGFWEGPSALSPQVRLQVPMVSAPCASTGFVSQMAFYSGPAQCVIREMVLRSVPFVDKAAGIGYPQMSSPPLRADGPPSVCLLQAPSLEVTPWSVYLVAVPLF